MDRGDFEDIVDQAHTIFYNRRNPSAITTDEVACNHINF
jgi:hypothetical protein